MDGEDQTPKPTPRDGTFDIANYPQDPDDPITDPNWCLWDWVSQTKTQVQGNNRLQKLVNYHKENFGLVHPFVFVQEMQSLYNTHLRKFIHDPKTRKRYTDPRGGPAWPANTIYNWARKSVMSAHAGRIDTARTLQMALDTLQENQLFLLCPNGKRQVDLKVLKETITLSKELRYWYDKIEGMQSTSLLNVG